MSEHIRSIHVHVEVDTNKRTMVLDEEADSFEDASRVVADWLADLL